MLARRDLIKSMGAGLGALPLATVLANSDFARAAADSLQIVEGTLADGRKVGAALAMPATTPAPAVMLIHEWWGLNDQIKAVAADFAQQGYIALAIDLMGGEVATTPDGAKALTGKVADDPQTAVETCTLWTDFLKTHDAGTGRVGTCGWCFGGGWSLNASLASLWTRRSITAGSTRRRRNWHRCPGRCWVISRPRTSSSISRWSTVSWPPWPMRGRA